MIFKKTMRCITSRILNNNHNIICKSYDLRDSEACPVEAYYNHKGSPCILNVRLENCRWYGASGLSYSSSSRHPYVQTLVEYEKNNHANYENSYLKKYWEAWKPANLAKYFGLDKSKSHPLLLNTPPNHNILPWSPSDCISYMQNRDWLKRQDYRSLWEDGGPPARSCGPKPNWFGKARFNHLLSIPYLIEFLMQFHP